jgi:outer membrane protein
VKNISLLLNGVLIIAVAVLYYLHFSSSVGSTTTTTSSNTLKGSAAQQASKRIVFVNTDSLSQKYEYYKDAQKELEEKQSKLDTELGGRLRALQNEAVAFQKKAATMTQEQGQQAEQLLMRKQQDLEQYRTRLGQQLAEEQQNKNREIYESIAKYLEKRNANSQYDYVIGYTRGNPTVLFANEGLDITKEVIEELNKEYKTSLFTPKK